MIAPSVKPRLAADQILTIAEDGFRPSKRFVMFSGGNDSTILLDWMVREAPIFVDAAVHINTGIGIEQTRDFVRSLCREIGVPLIEKHAPPGEYERLCREYGMPGPGLHWMTYRYLKDRQVEELVKEHRGPNGEPVMLITGVRRDESERRMGSTKPLWLRKGQLWVAPFIDWTKDDLLDYREANGVPENPVAALIHMSGECLCGAFAHPGEMAELESLFPEVARAIHAAEAIAKEAGQPHTTWGEPRDRKEVLGEMPLCTSCLPLKYNVVSPQGEGRP